MNLCVFFVLQSPLLPLGLSVKALTLQLSFVEVLEQVARLAQDTDLKEATSEASRKGRRFS